MDDGESRKGDRGGHKGQEPESPTHSWGLCKLNVIINLVPHVLSDAEGVGFAPVSFSFALRSGILQHCVSVFFNSLLFQRTPWSGVRGPDAMILEVSTRYEAHR